jgi:hypothetical protein
MNDVKTVRPFCFMSQFWGERYRDYFVNYAVPSLLAPNNLPLLRAEDGHCFLIATPREDWDEIEHLPIMDKLRGYTTPILIETPAPADSSYVSVLKHQTFSLKRLFEAAYARRAYGCAVWPDTIMSDGFVASMQRWVEAGYHLVMQPTVRLAEEGVLADLRAMKLLSNDNRGSLTAEPIRVPPRVVADLSTRHLHPEVEIMVEGHPLQPLDPPYRIWRMPNRSGLILHVFFATPVLIDFASVPANHTECLDHGDWETHYVGQNFSHCGALYVVADSDESGILSITPMEVNRTPSSRTPRIGARWAPNFALLCNLRASIALYSRDRRNVVRRDMFRTSVRWHADDIDATWQREESHIAALIERAAGDYYKNERNFPPRISLDHKYLPLDILNELQNITRFLRNSLGAVIGALTGNRDDIIRIRHKIGALISRLIGRPR